ncbi:DUF6491 family protein [Brevundimonas sp. R86498]|uniref:DUF6491 family protein n=1 Tax=Brevundimonas sp. R86498 TaxID=3093845 RepID=UPI0037C7A16E
MSRHALVPAVLLATLAACAPAAPGGSSALSAASDRAPRQCFQARQIINFREGDDQQIYLRVLGGEVFALASVGCWDLAGANALSVTPAIGGSDRMCVGDTAEIAIANASLPRGPCRARIDRVLTEAEITALPSRQRP